MTYHNITIQLRSINTTIFPAGEPDGGEGGGGGGGGIGETYNEVTQIRKTK